MKHFYADPGVGVIFRLAQLISFLINSKTLDVLQAKLLKSKTNFPTMSQKRSFK